MQWLRLLDDTVGQKIITAATGLGLIGFVVAHLLGNLQMFAGDEAINIYAKKLKDLGPLLWVARIGLLGLVSLHIAMTVRLLLRNRRAVGSKNRMTKRQASTFASRSMAISGTVILVFVIFHLAHFTFGIVQPEVADLEDSGGRHDVYTMVVRGFQNPLIAGFYILSVLLLTMHLSHASFSVFQTLGLLRLGQETRVKIVARVVAAGLGAGFIAIPVAVLTGFLRVAN